MFLILYSLLSAVMHRPLVSSCNPSLPEDAMSMDCVFYSVHSLLSF
jgi:hypothetical protein